MKCPRHNSRWTRLAALAVAVVHSSALAQYMNKPPPEDPQWMKLHFTEISAGVFAEGDYESSRMLNSGASSQSSRMFVGPTLGIGFAGSVYHPNLFQYQVNSQNAFGWGNESTSSPETSKAFCIRVSSSSKT